MFRCWWFGCKPMDTGYSGYKAYQNPEQQQCERCGGGVDYSDLVGDTRHNRFAATAKYWLFRKWFPTRCFDCGKRYGNHKDCLPF